MMSHTRKIVQRPLLFLACAPGLLWTLAGASDAAASDENPLNNLKVLYGTGTLRINDETGKVERAGGVQWTIKDGIVFDAGMLRADVRKIVQRDEW